MTAGDIFEVKIEGRFMSDLNRISKDISDRVAQAYNIGDAIYFEEEVAAIDDTLEFRLGLAVDSAAWQGFQIGRVDGIVEAGMGFNWNLDPAARHCETCLVYASGGPYTYDDLITRIGIPGDAPTICDGGCRCNLEPAPVA